MSEKPKASLLDTEEARDVFLSAVRDGATRTEASAEVGLAYSTVWRYLQKHPKFLTELRDAEERSVDWIFKMWKEIAHDDSNRMADRLKAMDSIAKHRGLDRKKDETVIHHEHTHTIRTPAELTADVAELHDKLQHVEITRQRQEP